MAREGGQRASGRGPMGHVARFFQWLFIVLVGALIIVIGAGAVLWVTVPIPNPNKDFATVNTHLYFDDGQTDLGTLSVQNRENLTYDQIPKTMQDAIVAAENPTFWTDPGVSAKGIARAITSIGSGAQQGGSTITQQYVKVLYLNQEKTLSRKVKEAVISLKLGQEQSKEEILAGYLNTVYYGRGAYGLGAASKAYFNVDQPQMLTLQQSVVLASLINEPSHLDPSQGPTSAIDLLERYQYVLNSMVDHGMINASQRDPIYKTLPAFAVRNKDSRFGGTNGYLMKMTSDELVTLGFDEATINGGGLQVTTTFDARDQGAAVASAHEQMKKAASENGKDASSLHASVVSIDNATGGVLALYAGNDDFVTNSRNWATTTAPTGSTFKTWVLTAALRQGVSLDRQLKGYTFTAADGKSVTGETDGMVTLQEATTNSINSAFVDLATQLQDGGASSIKAANDAGIPGTAGKDGWDADIRIGMGTAQVSPVDEASGYSTLANDGVHRPWHVVASVKDASGKVVYTAPTTSTNGISADVATGVTAALQQVTQSGTGKAVGVLGWPVAGKTGTRYDGTATRSSWFVGYTKQITTAVNVRAGESGNENLDAYSEGFYGAGYPASTWLQYMQTAMKGLPQQGFTASSYHPTQSETPIAAPVPSVTPTAPVPSASPSVTPTTQPTRPTTSPSSAASSARAWTPTPQVSRGKGATPASGSTP